MCRVVDAAVETVNRFRKAHGEGAEALRRLVAGSDDLNGGIAAALLGSDLSARLRGNVHDADRPLADAYIGISQSAARAQAQVAIAQTRRLLRLAPIEPPVW
jgi:hypothetical protein